ncbi:hypothetical protein PSPO01_14171 [Paraphaeosphaeria sporulosa]
MERYNGARAEALAGTWKDLVMRLERCKSVAARRPLVDARASISRGAPANPPGLGVNSETQKASGWASGWASCNATLAAASGPCVQARGGERDCPTRRQSQLDSSLTWKRTPRPQVFQSGPAVQLSSVSWLLLYCVCFSVRKHCLKVEIRGTPTAVCIVVDADIEGRDCRGRGEPENDLNEVPGDYVLLTIEIRVLIRLME